MQQNPSKSLSAQAGGEVDPSSAGSTDVGLYLRKTTAHLPFATGTSQQPPATPPPLPRLCRSLALWRAWVPPFVETCLRQATPPREQPRGLFATPTPDALFVPPLPRSRGPLPRGFLKPEGSHPCFLIYDLFFLEFGGRFCVRHAHKSV